MWHNFNNGDLMKSYSKPLVILSLVVTLAGCDLPGLEGPTFIRKWPTADQPMSVASKLEIERHLRTLNYMRSGVDGKITPQTRQAVKRYQRDIGAPTNGFIGSMLLASLRANVGVATAPAAPKATVTPRAVRTTTTTTTTRPTTTVTPTPTPTAPATPEWSGGQGDGGGGGGGGSGGGAWG